MDVVGYIGGGVLGIQLIPQIVKTYQQKSAKELSYVFLSLNMIGLSLMTAYGVYDHNEPVYVPTSVSLCMTNVLLFQKYYYDNQGSDPGDSI